MAPGKALSSTHAHFITTPSQKQRHDSEDNLTGLHTGPALDPASPHGGPQLPADL